MEQDNMKPKIKFTDPSKNYCLGSNILEQTVQKYYDEVLANRDAILEAFIAETGCKPSEIEMVEEHQNGVMLTRFRKREEPIPADCRHHIKRTEPKCYAICKGCDIIIEAEMQEGAFSDHLYNNGWRLRHDDILLCRDCTAQVNSQ